MGVARKLFGLGALAVGLLVAVKAAAQGKNFPVYDTSPAFDNAPPRRYAPRVIIIHHSDTSSAANTRAVLKKKGLSTNFEVEKDGRVLVYLDPSQYEPEASEGWNPRSIAIDVTHLSGKPWPPVQVEAVAWLVRGLVHQFGIPGGVAKDGVKYANVGDVPDDIGILRHRNTSKNTVCPEDFPMDRLYVRTGSTRAA